MIKHIIFNQWSDYEFFLGRAFFSMAGQSLQKARTFFIILMMCNNMYHMLCFRAA